MIAKLSGGVGGDWRSDGCAATRRPGGPARTETALLRVALREQRPDTGEASGAVEHDVIWRDVTTSFDAKGGGYRRVEALGGMSHSNRARQRAYTGSHGRRVISRERATRELCRQAAAFEKPLDLERWASSLLGQLWLRRQWVPADYPDDPVLYPGRPMVRSFARLGGSEGKIALTAIARIDRGPLGELAGKLAASLKDASIPDWAVEVGTAKVVHAFGYSVPGDGEALLLDTDRAGDAAHMLAVFIREQLDGIATILRLIRRVEPSDAVITGEGDGEGLRLRPVDPALACLRVLVAIERSDEAPAALIDDEDYAHDRAIAIARVTRHVALR